MCSTLNIYMKETYSWWLRSSQTWASVFLTLPLTRCATPGKYFTSLCWVSHLQNGKNNDTCLIRCLWRVNEMISCSKEIPIHGRYYNYYPLLLLSFSPMKFIQLVCSFSGTGAGTQASYTDQFYLLSFATQDRSIILIATLPPTFNVNL